jgi:hypothetical protein
MRPFEQQSELERRLRNYLYSPTERCGRLKPEFSRSVRRKEYRNAANCEDAIIKSEKEIQQWNELLELYEKEFCAAKPRPALELLREIYVAYQNKTIYLPPETAGKIVNLIGAGL